MDTVTQTRHTLAPPRPPHAASFWARNEKWLLGTSSMILFLAFWETSVLLQWVNPLFTSSPSRIVRAATEMFADGSIYYDLQVSGFEFLVGYGWRSSSACRSAF